MDTSNQQQKIADYISTQALGVITTVTVQGRPEAALLAVTETENLELIFGTESSTRKYRNLQHNPHVAFVIGHDFNARITIQYEGIAREISGDEAQQAKELHLKKNPGSSKYANKPQQRWFKVKPTWIRYMSLNERPADIFEISFDS